MKSMITNCIVGGIAFLFGAMAGAVCGNGSPLATLALIAASGLGVYVACRSALQDGQWMDAHSGSLDDDEEEPTANDAWSRGYDLGYGAGFDDATESLQFARPTKVRKPPRHRGA